MYFPLGWPKVLKTGELGQGIIKQIKCNRDRILFSTINADSLAIWFCKVKVFLGDFIRYFIHRNQICSHVYLLLFFGDQKSLLENMEQT